MRILPVVVFVCLAGAPHIAAQKPTPAQLSRAGWSALDAGRVPEALAAFEAALRLDPQQPPVLLGAGIAAHLQGRADEARRFLVDALKLHPGLTEASLVLGAVLYQGGDIDGAIDAYQQALAHTPDHVRIVQQLAAWRKEAALHSGFGRKLANHFTVLFEGPAEAQLAERAVAILEAAYLRIGTTLYTYPTEVITVVLYTREQFRDITQSPEWAGGAFDGRIRMPVQGALADAAEFGRVLTHEFTHALVHSIAGRGVPFWLDEGLAVRFESMDPGRGRARLRALGASPRLERLERSFAGLSAEEASAAYAVSAAAVDRMFDAAGAPAVVSVLEAIGSGVPFAEAFERHMSMGYTEFQKTFGG
ncbi:MAG: tetratricopeptide repeat protein [Acidobacteriota bacterium]|nr:tetratricopeptide repeat protein [Acidobacteriota bacterium]